MFAFLERSLVAVDAAVGALSMAPPSAPSSPASGRDEDSISEELTDFICEAMCGHAELFLRFPDEALRAGGGDEDEDVLSRDPARLRHARAVLKKIPELQRLRFELVPRSLSDSRFWRIYFTLAGSRVQLDNNNGNAVRDVDGLHRNSDGDGEEAARMALAEREVKLQMEMLMASQPDVLWDGIEPERDTYFDVA